MASANARLDRYAHSRRERMISPWDTGSDITAS